MNGENDPSFIAAEVPQVEITQPPQGRFSEEIRTIIVGSIALGPSKLLTREEEVRLFGELNLGRQAQTAKLVCNGLRSFLGHEPEEVPEIEQIIEQGKGARDKIIIGNYRLVYSRACKFQYRGLAFPDLFQEGMFGLWRAIDKFDTSRDLKFSTLATKCIDQFIKRAIKEKSRTIHIPVGVNDKVSMIINKRDELLQRFHGREPTAEEIIEELGKNFKHIEDKDLVRYRGVAVSLNTPRSTDGRSSDTLTDTISDGTQAGVEEQAVESLTNEEDVLKLLALMKAAKLKERYKQILGLSFGLGKIGKGLSYEEIGKIFGVRRQRIEQIIKRGLEKLRDAAGVTTTEEVLEELKTKDKAGIS